MNLNGGEDTFATFGADTATLQGTINVDRNTKMTGSVQFQDPVNVTINDADDQLRLEGPATFAGGSYTGNGRLVQLDSITVGEDTTIDVKTFLWGNSGPFQLNQLKVNQNATLIINSESTNSINNQFIGNIVLTNSVLEVNTTAPWLLPKQGAPGGIPPVPKGALLMDASKGGLVPTLRGQKVILEGLISATGGVNAIEAALDTSATGEINIFSNSELRLKGATTYNGGNIHGNGTLRQFGDATIIGNTTINTAFMDWDGDEADPSDTFINPGVTFTIQSEHIEANPVFEGHSGHITVSNNAALVVITDITWLVDGTLTLLGQPVATPQAIVDGSPLGNFGTVEGNGWFQSVFANAGTLRPGLSAGSMRFESDLILYNESVVEMEVGGATPRTQFDQIRVSNNLYLNGLLDVSLINGYTPPIGAGVEYNIILPTFVRYTGTFDAVNLPPMLRIEYRLNTVTLIPGLPGDLNGDGFVGIEDLYIVLGNWNQNQTPGVWSGGDPSGDGFVGIADLNTVLSNWNNGTPPLELIANIPEPGAGAVLVLCGYGLLRRRLGTARP
jgi:hypothetical protein